MEWLFNHLELVLTCVSALFSCVVFVVYFIKRFKALKTAKTSAEKDSIVEELKTATFGLISATETMFSDISKSGSSKLLYVLRNVEKLCNDRGVEFIESEWTAFINKVVDASNAIAAKLEHESAIPAIIEKIKQEIPYFVADANELFKVIPDSAEAEIDYILKLISNTCAKEDTNVFELYDWKAYVEKMLSDRIVKRSV